MFITAVKSHLCSEVHTFALVRAHAGCRISEALEFKPERIDLAGKSVTFRTLKQREKVGCRSVPVPDDLLETLELVHGLRKAAKGKPGQEKKSLWSLVRTQAYKHIVAIMDAVGIRGE